MNELHKLKIVHRDIKPNNILLQILPTGEHVYKLSDFGAARQVEMDDDQFTSICGTEEYLFPDVYERALINRTLKRSFRAGIDLWSTGVSLYHVATGMLPFRPIGGRHNRDCMIKITKDKPSGQISGVQKPGEGLQIEYSNKLPDTCQLSKNLQNLIVPMLAGLIENNYDAMWTFQQFFDYSTSICDQAYVNVLNLDTCQLIEISMDKTEKLNDLKSKIESVTKIDKNSQLLIYNNLLLESLVTEQQNIDTYPSTDCEHPLVLFSLNNNLSCDNNNIIKSIPNLRCKSPPKVTAEIIAWSKETCGSINYIKREVYLITTVIELLKLSAIAFKSYMPEMKLKQQHLLYNFKSTIKSLETKLSICEKLKSCTFKFNNNSTTTNSFDAKSNQQDVEIKEDIKKFKTAINNYESEINVLSEKINSTQDLDFFVQNSSLTSKWKTEIDGLVHSSHMIYDELWQQKREIRNKNEQERFERSQYTFFKIKHENQLKESAVKLYQETIIVHFVDYYSRFEKWMSDLIKLHNELMSVQQKLIECEKSLNLPVDKIEAHLDLKIGSTLEALLHGSNGALSPNYVASTKLLVTNSNGATMASSPLMGFTPPSSPSESTNDSKEDMSQLSQKNAYQSTSSAKQPPWNNFDSLVISIRDFKNQAIEIEKALEENAAMLKYLHDKFIQGNTGNDIDL